jgi:YihY family inner membrane protein
MLSPQNPVDNTAPAAPEQPQSRSADLRNAVRVAAIGYAGSVVSRLRRHAWPTLKYLTQTEVHTYAFSVAANAILSLFPAIILALTLARTVFHSQKMFDVILQIIREYMPANQDFIVASMGAAGRHRLTWLPILMLFVSCTGIFLPLEVALNKVWGIRKNRSYLMNQLIALGLALACGLLALGSIVAVTMLTGDFITRDHWFWRFVAHFIIDVFGIPVSIGVFFLIYWVLPNGKVPARSVLPAAIIIGVLFELVRHAYSLAVPFFNFQESYGPFYVSVTLIFWAFLSGMLLLGGAFLSAVDHVQAHVEAEQND